MQVNARQVQELRAKTGAGIMDCKKAIAEGNGDMDKAIEYLRKNRLRTFLTGLVPWERVGSQEDTRRWIVPGSRDLGIIAAGISYQHAREAAPDASMLKIDRPFLFALRDRDTGAVLFLGRVTDPTAG